jgi:LPS export ABC transporter protein LptC
VQRTTGVDIIYSDSAKVKAKALAPLMLDYNTDNTTNTGKNKPYSVLPKGIKINFYTDSLTLSGTLVADSAILRDNNKIAEMYKNVVVTNAKGETFKSEQLIWDQNKKIFYSDKVVHIKMVTGTVMEGTSFTSDESFNHWKMQQSTGVIHVDSDLGQ